jgi:hypothetical protein
MASGELSRRERGEIMESGASDYHDTPQAFDLVTRAEIDVQIATAKRYPRSAERFVREACAMVSISPEIAEQCRYRLPARRGGDGKAIEGPSVRLAEIVAACWGNLRVVGRVVGDDGRAITAQGVAHDLERNIAYSIEVQCSVTTKHGQRYGDDMVRMTCLAAVARATRNATFKVIPRAFVTMVEQHAARISRGDEKTIPERLDRALKWFATKGVKEAQIFKLLKVVGRKDITLDHLAELQEYRTAITDGDLTVKTLFEDSVAVDMAGTRTERLAASLAPPEPEIAPEQPRASTEDDLQEWELESGAKE